MRRLQGYANQEEYMTKIYTRLRQVARPISFLLRTREEAQREAKERNSVWRSKLNQRTLATLQLETRLKVSPLRETRSSVVLVRAGAGRRVFSQWPAPPPLGPCGSISISLDTIASYADPAAAGLGGTGLAASAHRAARHSATTAARRTAAASVARWPMTLDLFYCLCSASAPLYVSRQAS